MAGAAGSRDSLKSSSGDFGGSQDFHTGLTAQFGKLHLSDDGSSSSPESKTVSSQKPETISSPKPETISSPKPESIISQKPQTIISPKPETIGPKPETISEGKPETISSPKPENISSQKPESIITPQKPQNANAGVVVVGDSPPKKKQNFGMGNEDARFARIKELRHCV